MDAVSAAAAAALDKRPGAPEGTRDFGAALKAALDGVNSAQRAAETLAQDFQTGAEDASLEDTMVALATANVSFQTLVQVRNRLVAAYQDIMNMPV
jgi:flagellar hook-basal body complex protein FliE